MRVQKHRLLSALRQAIDELAAMGDPLRVKEHYLAAHSILAELVRGDRLHDLRDKYERGRSLGLRLAEAIGQGGRSPVSNLPPRICHSCDQAATHALLDRLQSTLASLVAASGYPVGAGSEIDSVVLTLMRWEASLYEVTPLPVPTESKQLDIQAMLERSVRNQGGVLANARVVHCAPLLGGVGNTTVIFEAEDADMWRWPLVCRMQKDDAPLGVRGDIAGEFHLLCYLYRQGITVAQPLWLASKHSIEEQPFSVAHRLTDPQFEHWADFQSLNNAQIQSLASELARVHGVLIEASDSDLQSSHIDPSDSEGPIMAAARKHLDRWANLWRSVAAAPSSTIEATLQWLRVNAPQSNDEPVLVHGDYSPHNIVFEGDKFAGVLDWSLSHIGDRAEDLARLLSSLGSQVQADHFMREYVAAGGRAVTPFQLKYYEVMDYFKRLVVTQESRLRFDTLSHAGPEYFTPGQQFIQTPVSNIESAIRAAEATL